MRGDTVGLKSGKKLEGVQVVRETPSRIFVQCYEGLEPIMIPRAHVAYIEYDEEERGVASGGGPGVPTGIIAGKEVSGELSQKLSKPVSDTALEFEDIPAREALRQLSQRSGVRLELTERAQALLDKASAKDMPIPAETTLLAFLHGPFTKRFPDIEVRIMFDKVVMALKEEPVNAAGVAVVPPKKPEEGG